MKPEEIEVGGVYEGVLSAPRTVIAVTKPTHPEYSIVAYRVPRMKKDFHTAFIGEFAGWALRRVPTPPSSPAPGVQGEERGDA